MHSFSRGFAGAAAALVLGLSCNARADEFMQECLASTAENPQKTCSCMSDQISGAKRADAVVGLRKTRVALGEDAPDPSTLTPQEISGLQAVVVAQANCE